MAVDDEKVKATEFTAFGCGIFILYTYTATFEECRYSHPSERLVYSYITSTKLTPTPNTRTPCTPIPTPNAHAQRPHLFHIPIPNSYT